MAKDHQIMKQKRGSKSELGEPVILGCQPYKIPLTELLLPHKISPVEFFRLWPSLPAVAEYTGTYMYEGSGFMATAAQQYGASPFLSGLKSLSSKPFHRVCSHIIRTVAGFQEERKVGIHQGVRKRKKEEVNSSSCFKQKEEGRVVFV